MDVDAAAQHLLSVIFMERRVTPADLRDFTHALKEACDKVEQETAETCHEIIMRLEPHRFPGSDDMLSCLTATIQAGCYKIDDRFNRPKEIFDIEGRIPEPLGLALQEAAQELDFKEDQDAGTESEVGGEGLDRGGHLHNGDADRPGQDPTGGGGPGRHSDHAE